MLSSRKIFAGARVLLVLLLLWTGTHFSVAQSFSFPRLRLAATNGLTNRVFTAGDRVVPEVTVSNGVWYRVTVRDAVNVVKNPGAVCTPTTLFSSSDNSYTVQPGDVPTTNGTYKFILETFSGGACSGPPINSATQQFYVATVTAYTSPALNAATNRFTTAQTAHLRVEGLPPFTTNWNIFWILPNGSTSCVNTVGSDRPDVGTNSVLSSSYLAYPPSDAFADNWNDASSYTNDGPACQGFDVASQGEWRVHLYRNLSNFVTLPVFLLSNDCVTVTINPPARANCAGTTAIFTAITNGTGPFTLVWRKDGEVIPGVTGTVLNIPGVTTATAGVYSVESTGPCGSATNFATLFVSTLMSTQAIPNQIVCSNDTVIFTAPTNGAGPFNFQWRRGTTNLVGQTNSTLVLPNVTLTSTGVYRVVISNACNAVTNSGTLTVLPGLTVTPLTNLVRYVGTFASFSTTASAGSGATNFVWRKDGFIISGQTNRSLMLSNLAIADSGIYTVTASRTNGCSASASAELLVAYCFNSLDVMLVIDRSESMLGTPYTDARTAATNFVRNLVLGTNADIAGLASYSVLSSLNRILTNNAASVETAISALPAASGGTCISCGLNTAQAELTSIRHRVGALPVMVLLTDGIPKTNDNDSVSLVLSNAFQAKLAGTRIFTLGLNDGTGTNVDQALLRSAASSTNDFFYVNDSSQLTAVFDQISAILCRGPNRVEGPTPSNAVVCAGQTVQFDVSATGCALFTFEWSHNGVPLLGQTNPSLILPSVTDTDAGEYSVVISSFCGTVTNSATLTVHPNTFAIGSPSQTVCAGANVNFQANAGGAALTYQWRRNGVPLPGQTNATLSLTNVSPADAGNYRVTVSGLCGTVDSGTSALTVRTPPALTPLGDVVVCPGTPVTLQTTTNGTGPLSILWRKDGNLISGSNQPALHLGAVNSSSAGSYAVEVSGPCGSAMNFALVTVLTNTAATPLVNQVRCAGEAAEFSTVADGAGPFTFIWRHGGNILSGATNASLLLPVITTNDAGSYTVEVTGACGTVTRGALLTVRELTTATPLTDAEVCAGGAAAFSTVASGTGPFAYAWRHDGVLVDGATNAALNLLNLSATNAGVYSVEVSGACNAVTNSAALLVREVTTASALTNAVRCAGESATFETTVGGTGPFVIVWRRDGTVLPGATGVVLVLDSLSTNDTALYAVEVTGACGAVTNAAALVVQATATATPLPDATVCAGGSAAFTTVAQGQGPFTFAWRQDGVLIDGATNATLSLFSLSVTNAGIYSVEVSGACNAVTNSAALTVRALTTASPLADATRCAGEDVTFSTTASGTGPLTYLWRQGGLLIDGATNATLSLYNLAPTNGGIYSVEITGACGAVTNSALLTVLELVTATPLADATACESETVSFHTVASGAGPLTFVWRHQGAVLAGATNSTLIISNAGVADAGPYSVEVTGVCNAVTNAATLVVRLRTVLTPFEDVVACPGESLSAGGFVSGTGPFTIVWRRDGAVLAGQTNEMIFLGHLTTNDTATYAAEVTGACNSVTNAFALVVQAQTTVAPLTNLLVCVGASASFHAETAGTGPFTWQWRHDGALLPFATAATLTLTNVTPADAGFYTVMVAGECGIVTRTARVDLLEFTSAMPLAGAVRCAGEAVSFNTTISGAGPWQIVWRHDGSVISGETNSSLTLASVTANDAGIYSVEISGACNAVTNSATLTVNSPVTATPLVGASVCAGENVTFQTTPGGTGPFTFVWRHDGLVLEGATNSTLSLLSLSLTNAGIYSVEVSGVCGSVTNSAALTVLELLSATPLADAVRCAGESVTFSTTISGAGPWQIIWRRNGGALLNETNSSLALASVATNDAGLYSVEISGVCNAVTNSATLTVNSPVTATPLADASVCAGGSVTFHTTPGGTGPFTFIWRHNGLVLEGATNSFLSLLSLVPTNAGIYSVEVSGVCGSTTNAATLTVLQLTTATPLTNVTVCAGLPVSFATAASGTGPWTFVWRRNGTALLNETNSSLTFASVSTNDAGLYSVEISGACNTVTNSATLAVNALTTVSPLAEATVCAGDLIFLSVQVQGAGPHYYFWRRNGQLIITTPGLIIGSATVADSGLYSVEVLGACNRVTNFATITVRALTTVAPLTNAVRCAGESVSFNAITGGTGPFTYGWRKNGIALSGETNAVLSLNTLTTNDAALYSVQVTGACNVVTRSATLTVNEPVLATPLADAARCLGEPANFTTAISGTGPLTIQWRQDGAALAGETNASLAFTVTSTNDAGNYAVEITGACGAVTNHATLTVHPPITLSAVPDQILCAGESVTLASGLNGSGSLAFVWRRDGAVIFSATNSTLVLTNLSLADSGAYQVEVTSPCVALTNVMQLTVAAPPLALINEARCVGDTVIFHATASTNAPFTFVWRLDGVRIDGATNATLSLLSLSTTNAGLYSVEVDGACGRVTNSAALTILLPPSIAPLANQAQCAGANVTFNAVVSGSGPFTFAWRKDGVLILGATNASLNFTNVTPADTALYSIESVGVCAAATNAATLTVSTVPVIAALTNFPVCLGQDALLAPLISGVGEFTKLWRKNGVELAGETNATLFLGAVSNATAGIYTLEVSGACGRATNHTTVAPRTNVVVAALTNQTVCAGGAVTFTANVTGTGPFTFVWKKNGAVVSNVTSSQLALTNLFPSDGALYTVEVTTFCNTATATALLTVESSLTATPLTNLTACVGQNVTFSTTASGGPPFTYLWRSDGSALTNQTNATLVLTNVQSASAGIYSVEVTGCGRATNSAQLAVTPPVTAALPPVITACACDDLTLAPTNLAPGSYTFAWRKNGALLVGETNAGLYLSMLNMHSPGNYSVEISGPCNSLTLQTALEVNNVNSGLWTNSDGAITMRDLNTALPYPSTNLVRCAPKTISQLRVTLLGLSHGFPDDIDIALIAPNGQGIKLMSDSGGAGGNALNNVTLVFDDAAPGLLPNGGFINPGAYRPTDAFEGGPLIDNFPAPGPGTNFNYATNLAAFLGSNPNGTWKLFVLDDHGGQQGVLTRWVLDFGRAEFVFPNLRLTAPVSLPGGALQMELQGEAGKIYFLEASTNLVNWTIIQTNQLNAASMTLTDFTAPQFNYRFYRASGCRE